MLPLKFILVPMGSAGDVHPFIWMAKLLQHRGHDVTMICEEWVAPMAIAAGITTRVTGDPHEHETLLNHPDLWHPRRAINLLMRYMPKHAREQTPVIQQELRNSSPDQTVLLAGSLAFAARILSERHLVPLVTVHLQPSLMMSAEEPGVMTAGGEWLQRAPLWFRKMVFGLVHWQVDRKLLAPISKLRREVGITEPLTGGLFKTWWHSPHGVLCLFPDWYARQANDWPPQTILSRFPLYDESAERAPDPALTEFLRAGDDPIVITPGSANTQAARFLGHALQACEILGRRPLVLTRYPEQLVTRLPAGGKIFKYIPFSQIFPHAAAVIHHGGIGTTAQALAAGIPQLLMPMAHDQPDNAARLKRFGVGDYLYPKKFRPPLIAEKLETLLHSPQVQGACTRYSAKMRRQMSEETFTDLLESTAQRLLRVRQINGPGVPA